MLNWSYNLQNKSHTRQQLLNLRRTISLEQRDAAAIAAKQVLIESDIFAASQTIACYFAEKTEFNCHPIIDAIWAAKKQCFLPVLSQLQKNFLEFAPYCPNDVMQPNRYQILEPINKTRLPAEAMDLVLLPLVGFDLKGHRLGMGGGYYDRTFAFKANQASVTPYLIGLAYEAQKLPELDHDEWDVPLDGVLTEQRLYFFK